MRFCASASKQKKLFFWQTFSAFEPRPIELELPVDFALPKLGVLVSRDEQQISLVKTFALFNITAVAHF
jgi:hypothetical protein